MGSINIKNSKEISSKVESPGKEWLAIDITVTENSAVSDWVPTLIKVKSQHQITLSTCACRPGRIDIHGSCMSSSIWIRQKRALGNKSAKWFAYVNVTLGLSTKGNRFLVIDRKQKSFITLQVLSFNNQGYRSDIFR